MNNRRQFLKTAAILPILPVLVKSSAQANTSDLTSINLQILNAKLALAEHWRIVKGWSRQSGARTGVAINFKYNNYPNVHKEILMDYIWKASMQKPMIYDLAVQNYLEDGIRVKMVKYS